MDTASPAMIVLCGLMGTGKTTVAQAMNAYLPSYIRLNTDDVRKLLGKTTFDPKDTPEVNNQIYFTMRLLLYEGKGVISDSANKTKIVRERIYTIARESRAPILVIECTASQETVLRRISERPARDGIHLPTNKIEDYHTYLKLWENTDADRADVTHRNISFIRVDTDTSSIEVLQRGTEGQETIQRLISVLEQALKGISVKT